MMFSKPLRNIAGFGLKLFRRHTSEVCRNENFCMFGDKWKILIFYLFLNELHQFKPYQNFSMVITYKKFTDNPIISKFKAKCGLSCIFYNMYMYDSI